MALWCTFLFANDAMVYSSSMLVGFSALWTNFLLYNINRESACRLSRSPFSLHSLELGAQLYQHQLMASSMPADARNTDLIR
jgi:hypothetical protein